MQFFLRKFYHLQKNFLYFVRIFYYRHLFKHFGIRSRIYGKIHVICPENISLGSNSTLNEGVLINAYESVLVGDNVHISSYVQIITAFLHNPPQKNNDRLHGALPIVIEDGVWIGAGAIINPGVRIGKNTIVGSGAVVTKNLEADSIYVGVPAKFLKKVG
ncbi:acyltransferase [Candidatus Peregrinibacteria bacterium]|nr:acyltransferase [Candidatus Peregrinibacteria bacterium]